MEKKNLQIIAFQFILCVVTRSISFIALKISNMLLYCIYVQRSLFFI